MTIAEARTILQKKFPGKVIKKAADFDKDNFIFIAMDKGHTTEVSDPNYLVNKKTGSVRQFNPLEDLDKFIAAVGE